MSRFWTAPRVARLRAMSRDGASITQLQADPLLGTATPQALKGMITRLQLNDAATWREPEPCERESRQTKPPACIRLTLAPEDAELLRDAAAQRGMPPSDLGSCLLHFILADNLVDAVIDA
jgi:hypothetical protein